MALGRRRRRREGGGRRKAQSDHERHQKRSVSLHRGNPLSGWSVARVAPAVTWTSTPREQSSPETSPRQLEHETESPVECDTVEVRFLTNGLTDRGIEELRLGRA